MQDERFSPGMEAAAQRGHRVSPTLLVSGLVAVGSALRFWHLGYWNFQATEMFTLRDSVTPQFHNSRPLGYLLNYYLVKPFLPLDEFGLRLLPAIFGVLAIPVFYLVARRLLGTRAALFGTLFVTISHLLVNYSQLARYWSLVFLLCAVYPYALYIGVREGNRKALLLGLVTGALAALAHPVSLLLLGGPAILIASQLRGRHLTSMWNQKIVRWSGLVALVIVAIIAWRFVPILHGWITMHDKNPGSGQFLLPTMPHGIKQVFYMLAFSEGLTVPVALAGVAGIYLTWRRDKPLGLYLASLAFFPLAFLTLITLRTPVSQYYLLPAVPAYFLGVGVFLDRLFAADWGLRPRWLLPATVTIIMISAGVPTLLSEHMNGRRYDFRGMAQWLAPRLSPGDAVFSDQPMVMGHYLPGTKVQRLRPNTAPLEESFQQVNAADGEGAVWIVAPARGHTFRTDLKAGGLIGWIYDHCQLRNITGNGRVDFRAQYLHLYRCPPTEASPRTESASALGRDRVPIPR